MRIVVNISFGHAITNTNDQYIIRLIMNSVPDDGDVIIHYYLPSGARLELQIYFSRGENPKQVLQRLFESESVTCTILPDILRILFDLFQMYRRTHPIHPCRILNLSSHQEDHPWKKYSMLFQSSESLKTLKGVELELLRNTRKSIEKRKQLLICEENRYVEATTGGMDTSKEHQEIMQEIEREFRTNQEKVKEEFWKYVSTSDLPKKIEAQSMNTINEDISEVIVSLGAQEKHKFIIFIKISDDICIVPSLPGIETKETEDLYLIHPENVYKRYITCLALSYQVEGTVQILPELIRKSEETPELHFDQIREQISNVEKEEESIIFTRHSNIEGVQGAFHIPHHSHIPHLIGYSNFHGVKQLVFPIYEWEQISAVTLIGIVRSALSLCPYGDLEIITFLVETEEDVTDILNGIKLVFSETIISINKY